MRLLLVRHGQSEWNAARRLQGQADIGLSELGRAQADMLRPVIEAITPCRVVSSDLKRVRETGDRLGVSAPRLTQDLREIDVGDWTGRAIEDIQANDDEAYQGWRAGTHVPPGGESWASFTDRVTAVIEQECRTPCRDLLVVCHGGVIRALLQRYIGLHPSHIIPVAPASLSALRLGKDTSARLELFNYRPDNLDFGAPD
ncbi:histidine phosphatase family protein [Roseobacter sinensis]|uniref:Histidine phosphatase family protein n=1 Tax=Roseobacter sinensis TaxID=2931391 RepID=A0ABT3BJL3_9RHOB|nr:histidine phosphatase family protein [Roseobacter sp. WL0113]MCV3273756.1 histidine phosphatase family protein [Roseobacter sp. WL0113]